MSDEPPVDPVEKVLGDLDWHVRNSRKSGQPVGHLELGWQIVEVVGEERLEAWCRERQLTWGCPDTLAQSPVFDGPTD